MFSNVHNASQLIITASTYHAYMFAKAQLPVEDNSYQFNTIPHRNNLPILGKTFKFSYNHKGQKQTPRS